MDTQTIILIASNIVVPIVVAIITGSFQSKKYKKEIELIEAKYKAEKENLELQLQHQIDLENQKTANDIVSGFASKVGDAVLEQPATKQLINKATTRNFLKKHK